MNRKVMGELLRTNKITFGPEETGINSLYYFLLLSLQHFYFFIALGQSSIRSIGRSVFIRRRVDSIKIMASLNYVRRDPFYGIVVCLVGTQRGASRFRNLSIGPFFIFTTFFHVCFLSFLKIANYFWDHGIFAEFRSIFFFF